VQISAPACAADEGSLCQWVWQTTGIEVLADNGNAVLSAGLHILIILIVALLARFLVYRAINRVTRMTVDGSTPAVLRPLRAGAARTFSTGQSAERRAQRTRAIASLLKSISSFLIVAIAAVLILAELGIDIAPLLASAGIAGVALAFGAQNLVKDFLAGIFMTFEDQFGVGDTVDLGLASGTVVEVTLRTTTVRAGDGTIWHVRNGEVLRVGNSSQGEAVVTVQLPLRYDADTDRAGRLALDAAREVAGSGEFAESVVEQPTLLGIVAMAPGVVTIGLSATVRAGDQDRFLRAVRGAVKTAFDAAVAADPAADFRPPVVPPAEPA
jgi:small conductance mechanosensitive channel